MIIKETVIRRCGLRFSWSVEGVDDLSTLLDFGWKRTTIQGLSETDNPYAVIATLKYFGISPEEITADATHQSVDFFNFCKVRSLYGPHHPGGVFF